MHKELWAGVELKLQYAKFHLQQMERSLNPPEGAATYSALQAMGTIIDSGWQRSLWPHFDAFLSTARSIPEIIQCCFGKDDYMKRWFKSLPDSEQTRRKEFRKQFETDYTKFRELPLGTARHISEHRTGYAPVKVTINGRFGVIHTGNPVKPLPISETRHIEYPNLAWMVKPVAVLPTQDDFDIEGQSLFSVCQNYLESVRALIDKARSISHQIHGTESLTSPPDGPIFPA